MCVGKSMLDNVLLKFLFHIMPLEIFTSLKNCIIGNSLNHNSLWCYLISSQTKGYGPLTNVLKTGLNRLVQPVRLRTGDITSLSHLVDGICQ